MFSFWYVTILGYKGKNPSNTVSTLIFEILRTKLKYVLVQNQEHFWNCKYSQIPFWTSYRLFFIFIEINFHKKTDPFHNSKDKTYINKFLEIKQKEPSWDLDI